jgi:hypothetical protein
MATDILIKRSTTTGAVPTTGDLSTGELAINTVDKRLFTNNGGTIVEIGTAPTSLAVTNNTTVGGTLGVTGTTTLTTVSTSGAATLASGSVTGNFSVAGTLTVATPSNSTDAASKGYVDTAVANVIDSAPGALDTLNELAAAINDDANFATTITNSIATKLPLAGGTMTGDITLGANKATSTATPTTDDTLTRKGYVDSILGSATSAATSATAAASSATDAANSASAASTSASNASTSETNASASASAAATSATNAASSATAAASSATSASNSATASANSATAAATSATNAENAYDSFDDRYLGAKASDPSVDNDGDALLTGAIYFNTTDNVMKVYGGSSWANVTLGELVSDTTPQLGGTLDANGNDIDMGTNTITDTKVGQWDTAYGWGDHSTQNYAVTTGDTFTGDLILSTTGALTLPVGTEAQRPTPVKGMFRFNDDSDAFEGYDGSAWGAVGGGNTAVVGWENQITVAENYTVTTGNNMVSAGPITIDTGYTVTVPTGSRWVVV